MARRCVYDDYSYSGAVAEARPVRVELSYCIKVDSDIIWRRLEKERVIMNEELLSLKEAAAYMGCTTTKLNDITIGSIIPLKCLVIGHNRGYKRKDLDEWKERFIELSESGKVARKMFSKVGAYKHKCAGQDKANETSIIAQDVRQS